MCCIIVLSTNITKMLLYWLGMCRKRWKLFTKCANLRESHTLTLKSTTKVGYVRGLGCAVIPSISPYLALVSADIAHQLEQTQS